MPSDRVRSGRRLSSASLGASPRGVTLDILPTSPLPLGAHRRASASEAQMGYKFRPVLIAGEYKGQKRRYKRRPSRVEEGVLQDRRAKSESRVPQSPSLGDFVVDANTDARSPTSSSFLTTCSNESIAMDPRSRVFFEAYGRVGTSGASIAVNLGQVNTIEQNAQAVDNSLPGVHQEPELGSWLISPVNEASVLVPTINEAPHPLSVVLPADPFHQVNTDLATPPVPPTYQTSQYSVPSTLMDPSFVFPNPSPSQMVVDDIASVRIAKHNSPTRTNADRTIQWHDAQAPMNVQGTFTPQVPTPYEPVPPFAPSSSSLVGALDDTSNYQRDPTVGLRTVGMDHDALSSKALDVGEAYADSNPQIYSQPPTVSEEWIYLQAVNNCNIVEVETFDRGVTDDDGYNGRQNNSSNSATVLQLYPRP